MWSAECIRYSPDTVQQPIAWIVLAGTPSRQGEVVHVQYSCGDSKDHNFCVSGLQELVDESNKKISLNNPLNGAIKSMVSCLSDDDHPKVDNRICCASEHSILSCTKSTIVTTPRLLEILLADSPDTNFTLIIHEPANKKCHCYLNNKNTNSEAANFLQCTMKRTSHLLQWNQHFFYTLQSQIKSSLVQEAKVHQDS